MIYRERVTDSLLKFKLQCRGAVIIEGPRFCGKTTSAKHVSKSWISLDQPFGKQSGQINLADINLSKTLEGATPRLIDEWQVSPRIWDAVRHEVDARSNPGQFILTGSSTPIDANSTIHSGTGRFAWLKMNPMSLYESGDSNGQISIETLFKSPESIEGISNLNSERLAFLACRGGWPDTINVSEQIALAKASDYYQHIIKIDLNRVDGRNKNMTNVQKLMPALSRHQGAQVSNATLLADLNNSISIETLSVYLNALKKIYILSPLTAWNPNLRSKIAIRTSDTNYFVDPSIACASLQIGQNDLFNDLNTFELIFETLAIRDLRIFAESLDGDLYHYRDKNGLECDAVIHLRNGQYGLIEIKLADNEYSLKTATKNLLALKNKIDDTKMKLPSFLMVLTGTGKYAYRKKDGIYVVPIGCLKN